MARKFGRTALPRVVLAGVLVSLSGIRALTAQVREFNVTGRVGIGIPDDRFQSNCGHSSLGLGLDLHTRGRRFTQLSLEHFTGSGGGDVLCLGIAPGSGELTGGLRLEGASRIGIGAGARVGGRYAQLDGVLGGGLTYGRPGYTQTPERNPQRFLPHAGGQLSAVFFRVVVLSGSMHWTRLPLEFTPAAGGSRISTHEWKPLTTLQLGLRLPP